MNGPTPDGPPEGRLPAHAQTSAQARPETGVQARLRAQLYGRLYIPLKLLTAAALGWFAWRVLTRYLDDGHPIMLLVLAGEVIAVGLVLIAPRPSSVTLSPRALLFTNASTFYFLFVSLEPGVQILPATAAGLLVLMGICWQIGAKLTLGRSFGLLPALRRVVVAGPYRLMRHPIYFGYLCTHVGYFCFAASWHNLIVYAVLYACQVMRILDEEALLAREATYHDYMQRVRFRLIPGVW
jgi:protein-S-isoprenylcysteine O-methyltransferase Ste14